MAGPAIFAAPYVAPAIGEGILWGAGALGAGLASLGIIENKDAIENGIRDFGTSIKRGTENGIRAWSEAMSPVEITVDPSVDQKTGRYIAVPDATRVSTPYVQTLLPEALNTSGRVMVASGSSSTGTAQPSGRTRGRRKPATPAPTTGTNTGAAGSSTAAPTPNPQNDNDSTKVSRATKAWQWVKAHPKTSIAVGAGAFYPTREWVVKPTLNYVGPAVGNAVSYVTAGEAPFNIPAVANDSTDLWYRGGVGKVLNPSLTRQGYPTNYKETDAAVEAVQNPVPVDTFTRAPMVVPDTSRVRNGIVFVSE